LLRLFHRKPLNWVHLATALPSDPTEMPCGVEKRGDTLKKLMLFVAMLSLTLLTSKVAPTGAASPFLNAVRDAKAQAIAQN
jgi:hypothetical protein